MKTPIRWAGSKKALLPTLRQYWTSAHKRYVEPFCGSACLFFDLEPRKAILNDINGEIITAYRALADSPLEVIERLAKLKANKRNYYQQRAIDPHSLSEVDLAARFIFLNRLCFNGIYRTNKLGQFNVPYAKPKGRLKFDVEGLLALSTALKKADLCSTDFEKVLDKTKAGDLVYLDPPYAVATRRVFAEYNAKTFSTDDVERLRAALRRLHTKGVHFVVSYADSKEGRTLARDWHWRRVRTRRNVAGFASDRKTAYEVLASNMDLAA